MQYTNYLTGISYDFCLIDLLLPAVGKGKVIVREPYIFPGKKITYVLLEIKIYLCTKFKPDPNLSNFNYFIDM